VSEHRPDPEQFRRIGAASFLSALKIHASFIAEMNLFRKKFFVTGEG
jgi:hypothetical protein